MLRNQDGRTRVALVEGFRSPRVDVSYVLKLDRANVFYSLMFVINRCLVCSRVICFLVRGAYTRWACALRVVVNARVGIVEGDQFRIEVAGLCFVVAAISVRAKGRD